MGMDTNGPEQCPCCGKNGDGKGCHRCLPQIALAMINAERDHNLLQPIASADEVMDDAMSHYRMLARGALRAVKAIQG